MVSFYKKLSQYFVLFLTTICFFHLSIIGQNMTDEEMHKEIMNLDKMLFQAVFEDCDSVVVDQLLHPDCVFYHDQSGIIPDKTTFIQGLEYGPCSLEYKATRELDENSVEIFPMYQQGTLYGVIQQGIHRFYAQYPGNPDKELTSVARFSHLWLKGEDGWQLINILSYDHQPD